MHTCTHGGMEEFVYVQVTVDRHSPSDSCSATNGMVQAQNCVLMWPLRMTVPCLRASWKFASILPCMVMPPPVPGMRSVSFVSMLVSSEQAGISKGLTTAPISSPRDLLVGLHCAPQTWQSMLTSVHVNRPLGITLMSAFKMVSEPIGLTRDSTNLPPSPPGLAPTVQRPLIGTLPSRFRSHSGPSRSLIVSPSSSCVTS
mmetsp:Transcript_66014/g.148968  ORF Transcript_66014/g.148968 Transcript_66014/m.148968 type:complete len:200 (-) Transcript_66014:213-812(-)